MLPPPRSTLFPYTTLFRSSQVQLSDLDLALNDMHVRGSAAIADLDKMALRFDLGADDINLDRLLPPAAPGGDRKSTRLNSSHSSISYAVFCLKKKNYSASM